MNKSNARIRLTAFIVTAALAFVSSGFAQTANRTYQVELVVVGKNNKSVETDADLTFGETAFKVVPDKRSFSSERKELAYADVKSADYSYSKKPILSMGGAVATAILISLLVAIPLLFVKKKKHWMTVQTGSEYVVLKLGDRNWRQIRAEFETHGVKVVEVKEEKK
jgi:hypothetical protein